MKRSSLVIITMIVVAVLATWMLGKFHSAVSLNTRIFISVGGAILSGILTFILSKQDVNSVDSLPNKR